MGSYTKSDFSLSELVHQFNTGQLSLTCGFQRRGGAWNNILQSELIYSILNHKYILPIVLWKKEDGKLYALDGQHRLTSFINFLSNKYKLHSATEPISFNNSVVKLSGKYCSKDDEPSLDKDVAAYLGGMRPEIVQFEGTYEEAKDLYYRLNSGVALSKIQVSKGVLSEATMLYLDELRSYDFFTQYLCITNSQAIKEDDLVVLIQSLLLLDDCIMGYPYTSISVATCCSYLDGLTEFSSVEQKDFRRIFKYLSDSCKLLSEELDASQKKNSQIKFLKKTNAPIVAVMAYLALDAKLTEAEFADFLFYFIDNISEEYKEASGSGNVRDFKVRARLQILSTALQDYLNKTGKKVALKPYSLTVSEENVTDVKEEAPAVKTTPKENKGVAEPVADKDKAVKAEPATKADKGVKAEPVADKDKAVKAEPATKVDKSVKAEPATDTTKSKTNKTK